MVSVIRSLDTGENIITGIRRMASKRAIDYKRNEASIMKIVSDDNFSFRDYE